MLSDCEQLLLEAVARKGRLAAALLNMYSYLVLLSDGMMFNTFLTCFTKATTKTILKEEVGENFSGI